MKELRIRMDSPYGEQHDLFLDKTFVRLTKDKKEIRIFFGDGIPPVWVPKDSKMYEQLIKQFDL